MKRILRYLKGTNDPCLYYPRSDAFYLGGYADPDYARDFVNKKNTSGVFQFLGSCMVSWGFKKKNIVSLSASEAEFVVAATCCSQLLWNKTTVAWIWYYVDCVPIYCANTSVICISKYLVRHSRATQIHIRYHLLNDNVERGLITLEFFQTHNQLADILTKPLNKEKHEKMRLKLSMIKLNWLQDKFPQKYGITYKFSCVLYSSQFQCVCIVIIIIIIS